MTRSKLGRHKVDDITTLIFYVKNIQTHNDAENNTFKLLKLKILNISIKNTIMEKFYKYIDAIHFSCLSFHSRLRRKKLKYQRGNQNPHIEEEQTTPDQKKIQKDKQRSTKYTYKTKDRVTRTLLTTGGKLSASEG